MEVWRRFSKIRGCAEHEKNRYRHRSKGHPETPHACRRKDPAGSSQHASYQPQEWSSRIRAGHQTQFLEIMFLLLLLRVRNRREDVFAHITGVLHSPRPFHSLSLLSRVLRVTDFTSISPGFSQHSIYFKICNENK